MWTQSPTGSSPVSKSRGPKDQTPRSPGLEDGILTSQERGTSDTFQQFIAGSSQMRASAINPTPKSASAASLGIPEVLVAQQEGGAIPEPAPFWSRPISHPQASGSKSLRKIELGRNLGGGSEKNKNKNRSTLSPLIGRAQPHPPNPALWF